MSQSRMQPIWTNRRQFLRIIGGVGVTATMAPGYLMAESVAASEGVLIEASSFGHAGGWKLDTQHYQQMGGCYLLAHGMGVPVNNARAEVELPEAGQWNVWVRNRDWCKGEWQSPGRFRVIFDGKPLPQVFGEGDSSWHWQYGGAVQIERAGKVAVELEDLTGFDGRCDAIYLTREEAPKLPNADLAELTAWKDQLSGRAKLEIPTSDFDLVIVGGGMAGCGAAMAARKAGLNVALIQDRPIFGGNASEEVRVHTIGIHGYGTDIISLLGTKGYKNGHEDAAVDQRKREAALAASGCKLFAGHMACGLEKKDGRIVSVETRDVKSGQLRRFRAPTFIDATGDGWLGYWGGAEYRSGREAASEFGEQWEKQGDLWSPEKPDNRVMGTSVLWNAERTNQREEFPDVPWAKPVAKEHEATGGEWYWEYSDNDLDQIEDAEQIRDHVLRAIYGSFANAKRHPKNAPWRLKWVAYVGGKRESRRLMGDHIYTMHDAANRREFPDAVVVERREIDSHYQRNLTGESVDFLSTAMFYDTGGDYFVPFRSLYSKDIPNLMMAGRCFSCSHIGLAGPRVMNTCCQMGIATGYAASLCRKYQCDPREIASVHISELRSLIGFDSGKIVENPIH